ncbi:FMRFamide receptor [Orchesella cincta]|uniref:FMRFamide receptor n=1 Tax=Orchesella cincta TaxID=48709 RepID=A0A1D2MLE6_ORCCI|nr:FMRFamide receptor [Orchesella cincta]
MGETLFTPVLTLIIAVFGLFGNFLCMVVLLNKRLGNSSYIYLLQGLTFSDILLLMISILRTVGNLDTSFTFLTDPHLQTVLFFWDWICTSGCKFFTVAIALERFFVINFPLLAHRVVTVKRAKLFAFSVLIFSVALSCFSYIYANYISQSSFDVFAAVVLHFTPFLVVLVLNVFILIGMHRYKTTRKSLRKSDASNSEEESISLMLLAVVFVFGFCYSFEFIRRIMVYARPHYMSKWSHYDYPINHLADIFYVLNSSVNFLIYCMFGSKFRSVFLKMFKVPCAKPDEEILGVSAASRSKI